MAAQPASAPVAMMSSRRARRQLTRQQRQLARGAALPRSSSEACSEVAGSSFFVHRHWRCGVIAWIGLDSLLDGSV